jgi:hypothetical protein
MPSLSDEVSPALSYTAHKFLKCFLSTFNAFNQEKYELKQFNHIRSIKVSYWHVTSSAFVEHGLEEVQLTDSDQNYDDQFADCEIFDGVFVTNDNFRMDDLSLFFELLVF